MELKPNNNNKAIVLNRLKIYKFRLHHYLDFLIGIWMITVIFLLGMEQELMARRVFFIAGAALILNNLITKHKSSLTEILCVKTHLWIDLLLGVMVGLTPFLYDTRLDIQFWCWIFAVMILLNALLAKIPQKQQRGHDLL